MKSLIMAVSMILAQNPEEKMQLVLDVSFPIATCQLYYIEDDVRQPLPCPEFDGSQITLYLKEYTDYELVIYRSPDKEVEIISITPRAYEVVDERDLDISADVSYEFNKGILCFQYETSLTYNK